jgi:hypothetical protein
VKKAVTNAITNGHIEGPTQILPRKDAALIIWGNKITGDISGSFCFHASKSVACKYHIQQRKKGKRTMEQFEEVDWEHLDLSLKSKANNYKIWQSKQALGFCGI